MADIVPSEARPTQEAEKVVKGLVRETQTIIHDVYGLDENRIPDASEQVWNGSPQELSALMGTPPITERGTVVFGTFDGEEMVPIIYFAPSVMDTLANSNPTSRLSGNAADAMQTVIEETSHFVYDEHYKNLFGTRSHAANSELVAVLDKFNVLVGMHAKTFGGIQSLTDQDIALYANANAANEEFPNGRPAEYIVGHELGQQYVWYLNQLHNEGIDPTQELQAFYNMSNKQQVEHLLYNVGATLQTESPQEDAGVAKVFQELGVQALHG